MGPPSRSGARHQSPSRPADARSGPPAATEASGGPRPAAAPDVGRAVAAERVRIARDLHDSVAHGLGLISIQAQAGQRLLEEGRDGVGPVLAAIDEVADRTLREVRDLVGGLRGPAGPADAPSASLARIEPLLAQVRRAGLPVEVEVSGRRRPLRPAVDAAAYRLVQEALTNSLRYATCASARVTVRYGRDALDLDVVDHGRRRRAADPRSPGFGLAGLRERVSQTGGEFWAGPRPSGDFVVAAHLPFDGGPS
jgi:signal transduction histidine kinase